MHQYFADTWYLVALANRYDRDHSAARRLEALTARAHVVTHDAVLTEMLSHFSASGPHTRQLVVEFVRRVLRQFRVEPAGRELFTVALDLYATRRDKEYSLVDCMSMQLMRANGMTHVLTKDHHFRQEGFVVLSDAQ